MSAKTVDQRPKLYIGDSRRMHFLESNSIDLIVTSPPYFNIKDYEKDGRQEKVHSKAKIGQIGDLNNFELFINELLGVWKESERVLKPNGKLVINVPLMPMLKREFTTHENRHIFDLNAEIQGSILKNIPKLFLLDTYIWNRTNSSKKLMFGSYPYPPNFYAQNTIEFVAVYVKEGKRQSASTSIKDESILTKEEWVDFTKQIWDIPIPNKSDIAYGKHSALMPEEIVRRCVRLYSFAGDTVLDPFAGSGTTLRVASQLGRIAIGVELVESYSETAKEKVPGLDVLTVSDPTKGSGNEEFPESLKNKILFSDCFDYLEMIPAESVDLVCVDPPYNLGVADWDSFSSDESFMDFTERWVIECANKVKPGGSVYVFNTPRNAAFILMMFEKLGFELQNWITWHKKDGFSPSKRRFRREQESILFLTKGNKRHVFNLDPVRIPYESTDRIKAASKTGILKNGKRWFPNVLGRAPGDVWFFSSERHAVKVAGRLQKPLHPTIKPLALMERIILASSNPGDIVVDFFAGSGSTLVAASSHGRVFSGCEKELGYFDLANSRIIDVNSDL